MNDIVAKRKTVEREKYVYLVECNPQSWKIFVVFFDAMFQHGLHLIKEWEKRKYELRISLKGLCHQFKCYFKKPKDIYISENPKISFVKNYSTSALRVNVRLG